MAALQGIALFSLGGARGVMGLGLLLTLAATALAEGELAPIPPTGIGAPATSGWFDCASSFGTIDSLHPLRSLSRLRLVRLSAGGTRLFGTWDGYPNDEVNENGSWHKAPDAQGYPKRSEMPLAAFRPETPVIVDLETRRFLPLPPVLGQPDPTFQWYTYWGNRVRGFLNLNRGIRQELLQGNGPPPFVTDILTASQTWRVFQLPSTLLPNRLHETLLVALSTPAQPNAPAFDVFRVLSKNKARLWAASDDLSSFALHDEGNGPFVITPNGRYVSRAMASLGGRTVDVNTTRRLRGPTNLGSVWNAVFSPSSRYLLSRGDFAQRSPNDPLAYLWKVDDEKLVRVSSPGLEMASRRLREIMIRDQGHLWPGDVQVKKVIFGADDRWAAFSVQARRRGPAVDFIFRVDLQNPNAPLRILTMELPGQGHLSDPDFTLLPDGNIRAVTGTARGLVVFDSRRSEPYTIAFPNPIAVHAETAMRHQTSSAIGAQISQLGETASLRVLGQTIVIGLRDVPLP